MSIKVLPHGFEYPSNDAPSLITNIDFPELTPLDSSYFRLLSVETYYKTYEMHNPPKSFYQKLEKKCRQGKYWKKNER